MEAEEKEKEAEEKGKEAEGKGKQADQEAGDSDQAAGDQEAGDQEAGLQEAGEPDHGGGGLGEGGGGEEKGGGGEGGGGEGEGGGGRAVNGEAGRAIGDAKLSPSAELSRPSSGAASSGAPMHAPTCLLIVGTPVARCTPVTWSARVDEQQSNDQRRSVSRPVTEGAQRKAASLPPCNAP